MFVLSVVLLMTSFVASARSYDGQLVYNPVEEKWSNGRSDRLQNERKYSTTI